MSRRAKKKNRLAKTRLKHFDKLDELGLLIELPCTIGDTVYVISDCRNIPAQLDGTLYDGNGGPGSATGYYCPYSEECPFDSYECEQNTGKEAVFKDEVEVIQIGEFGILFHTRNCNVSGRIGVDVFLEKEDAQKFLEDKKDAGY